MSALSDPVIKKRLAALLRDGGASTIEAIAKALGMDIDEVMVAKIRLGAVWHGAQHPSQHEDRRRTGSRRGLGCSRSTTHKGACAMTDRLKAAETRAVKLLCLRLAMNADDTPSNRRIAQHVLGEAELTDNEHTRISAELEGRTERRRRMFQHLYSETADAV